MPSLNGLLPLPISTLPNTYLAMFISLMAPLLLILVLFHRVIKRSVNPVNWPFLGMLPSLVANTPHLHHWTTNLAANNDGNYEFKGPWLSGMNIFFTADPMNTNHIFSLNRQNYVKGSKITDIFDILGDGLIIANDESWLHQRRRAHTLISSNNFRAFLAASARKKVEEGLLPLLNHAASMGKAVDLQDVFLRYTFDVSCVTLFGVDTNCLSLGLPTIAFAAATDDVTEGLLYRHFLPMKWWKLLRWLRVGREKKFAAAWQVLDEFIYQQISKKKEEIKRKESNKEPSPTFDLLSSYIEDPMEAKTTSDYDTFLRDTVINNIVAGRDTSASGLTWFIYMLTKHRDVEAKILDELRAIAPSHDALNDDQLVIFDVKDLNKLVYLSAAIYESLRLFPPVPFNHRTAKYSDELPSGHRVQPGALIISSVYAMGRMEKVWGKDCNEFKPERWITEGGTLRHEATYKFLVFGTGPRMCVGKDTALTMVKIAAAALVYNFEVDMVQGHVVEPKLSVVLAMKSGLKVKVKKRKVHGRC
ncbi:alkane hydroxylase MAH1-like [Typha angustifolia]|uniref:alkane hydroxylase MAH1-like n=1 Tax=Typha angustifolia TaxID=59011 RepID=UPI003C2AD418